MSSCPSLNLRPSHMLESQDIPQWTFASGWNGTVAQIDAMAVFRNEREGRADDGQGNLYGRMKKVEKPAILAQS